MAKGGKMNDDELIELHIEIAKARGYSVVSRPHPSDKSLVVYDLFLNGEFRSLAFSSNNAWGGAGEWLWEWADAMQLLDEMAADEHTFGVKLMWRSNLNLWHVEVLTSQPVGVHEFGDADKKIAICLTWLAWKQSQEADADNR